MSNATPQDLVAEAKAKIPPITCEEYRAISDAGEDHTLIDVREQDEWDKGHIEGAMHIPRGVLEFKIGEVVPDKQKFIVLQCASGGRSALCGEQLQKLGYTNVKNLEGGYIAWCGEQASR
ncbi:sulfurtransferase [Patescibacteria group bacterium]|uniref:Sulfurtransferase n=1 Tax=candidate division WWE3 bacterium TaxID=2053526 RepID=A0A928TRT5_UNCKA|nr:sulfurtransferase [candidate division WWE3 bacterium]MCL4732733.1 sulfurtransferase [Patescibacteria group bacterium]MDL1952994.1 sulfurtransferase [Candidatus Uhrbacteria bacterium UHB]RIL00710.1 MAG: sulfurtransferase [Candidatus Uhrbacteria bacterium]